MQKNVEERMAVAKRILGGATMLMTKPLISLENRVIEGTCTGYQIQINNLSYRGIWLSTLEEIELAVDDKKIDRRDILLELNGTLYPLHTLQNQTETFWGIEDKCYLYVNCVGGLSNGSHKVELKVAKRLDFGHSYGEGAEGYDKAEEFHNPQVIIDEAEFTV